MGYALTKRERDCLDAIKRLTVDGVAPSYDEIGQAIGLSSKSGISRIILALEQRGRIQRLPGHARSIVVVDGKAAMIDSLVKKLQEEFGLDDGEGPLIIFTPDQLRRALNSVLV